MKAVRIFISSPNDVWEERQVAGRVIERLQGKYWSFVRLEDVFWETQVVRATRHHQEEIPQSGECEIVIGILWARLGSPLPEQFRKSSGETWKSGTEWELEQAFSAYETSLAATGDPLRAKPDIVVYRRSTPRPSFSEPEKEADAAAQETALQDYLDAQYYNQDAGHTIKRPIVPYGGVAEFEKKLSGDLEKLVLRLIPDLKPGFEPPPISGCPFKGLAAFDFADADRYFGRSREIRELQEVFRRRATQRLPFVLIYGASGHGKSSLMRAGLAPVLVRPGGALPGMERWRRVLLQPAVGEGTLCERLARVMLAAPDSAAQEASKADPRVPLTGLSELTLRPRSASNREDSSSPWDVANFAASLSAGARKTDHGSELQLAEDRLPQAVQAVSLALQEMDHYLLLEVDQLEAVFASDFFTPQDRGAFFRAIQLMCETRRVWTVATLQSEFFTRIASEPELRTLVGEDGGYILPPASRQSLREMIRYPALAARLEYQRLGQPPQVGGEEPRTEFLDEQILSDAEGSADALPLLSFTLRSLWERIQGAGGGDLLRWEDYARLRGLKGAIADTAARTFENLEPETAAAGAVLFACLVEVDSAGAKVTRAWADRATFSQWPGAQEFLDAFLKSSLLVSDNSGGRAVITLAHEALFTHWPVLRDWIRTHRADLAMHRRLADQTALWLENRRSKKFLLAEGRLAEAERVLASAALAAKISPEEKSYVDESRRHARHRLQFFQTAAAIFAVLAVAAALLGWLAHRSEQKATENEGHAVAAKKSAIKTLALSYHDRCVELLKRNDWRHAMMYCAKTLRLEPKSPLYGRMAFSLLLQHAGDIPLKAPWEVPRAASIAFSPQGDKAMLCTFGPPMLLNLVDGTSSSLKFPPSATGISFGAGFSSTGALALSDGMRIHFWPAGKSNSPPLSSAMASMMTPVREFSDHAAAALFPDLPDTWGGKGTRGKVEFIDPSRGTVSTHDVHQGKVVDASFVAGTSRMVSIGSDKTLAISDAQTGQVISRVTLSADPVRLAVSSAAQIAAVGYGTARIQMVDLSNPSRTWDLADFAKEDGGIKAVAFTGDGVRIAAGYDGPGNSGRTRVWDAASGASISNPISQPGRIESVAFDPEGRRLAVLESDALVSIYDGAGRKLSEWDAGVKGNALHFVQGGDTLAVETDDRRLQLFRMKPSPSAVAFAPLDGEARSLTGSGNTGLAGAVLDGGRRWQLWSPTALLSQGPPVDAGRPSLHSATVMEHDGKRWTVLVFDDGRIEVCDADGHTLSSRPSPRPLMDVFEPTANDPAKPVEVTLSISAGAGVLVDQPRNCVVVPHCVLHLEKAKQLHDKFVSSGENEEKFALAMIDPATGIFENELLFLQVPSLEVLETVPTSDAFQNIGFSADGKTCVSVGSRTGEAHLLRHATGHWAEQPLPALAASGTSLSAVGSLELSQGARWLGVISSAGAQVLDLRIQPLQWKTLAQGLRCSGMRFSPDEHILVLDVSPSDSSGSVQLWDLERLAPISGFLESDGSFAGMEFTSDSRLLATWTGEGALRFWDTAEGRAASAPVKLQGRINAAQLVKGDEAILLGGADKRLCLCAVPPASVPPDWVAPFLEDVGGMELDDGGNAEVVPGGRVFDLLASMRSLPRRDDLWGQLARFLCSDPDAVIPGTKATLQDEAMAECLLQWKNRDHSSALALLRETLRDYPKATVPPELERLEGFAKLRGRGFQTLEQLDGRKAGEVREGPAGIHFRWCPPGRFMMGSPATEEARTNIETLHEVVLSRGFWMSETKVTQGQWEAIMGSSALDYMVKNLADPTKIPHGKDSVTCAQYHNIADPAVLRTWSGSIGPDRPMAFVTWNDAQAFCARLSEKIPLKQVLGFWGDGHSCRLATESEWEYACRAGTGTATYAGNPKYLGDRNAPLLDDIAWYAGNSSVGYEGPGEKSADWPQRAFNGPFAGLHAVAQKKPNAWGLRDMLGDLYEWCQGSPAYYRDEEVNPFFTSGNDTRGIRGGSFNSLAKVVRAATRLWDHRNWRSSYIGFRVVLLDGVDDAPTLEKKADPQPQKP